MKMMESLNKNTEIVGVSDALKSLASKSLTKQNQVDDSDCDFPIMDNKITINPSSSIDDESVKRDNGNIMNNNKDATQIACGWHKFTPKYLQKFTSPKWMLFFLCIAGTVQGIVVNGFINVVISTIERRFGLESKKTGFIASGYDIASFFCLIPVSYFGGRAGTFKLRWVGYGLIIMGLGFFTFSLPHFVVGPYRVNQPEDNICLKAVNQTILKCSQNIEKGENLSWTVWIFFIAQLLHGIGASPLYTLGVTYIDENVSRKMSSIYLGYILGGQLLLLYTDFKSTNPSMINMTPDSKVWVGAWWLGFFIFSFVCLIIAIPLTAFPKELPGSEKLEKISEAHKNQTCQSFTKLNEMPKATTTLAKNPTFLFLNLAGASEGLIISGFAVFLPKQIENQFSVTPVYAALLMGIICVHAGGIGTFLGGYVVTKFKLSCSGTIKFCMVSSILAALFTICFTISCPNANFAGVTSSYHIKTSFEHQSLVKADDHQERNQFIHYDLENKCNNNCFCSKEDYEPICGSDGLQYFSPCFAGCHSEKSYDRNSKIYSNCSCILSNLFTNNMTKSLPYEAINKMCDSKCGYLEIFIVLCFFVMFFTFLATMPALSATLRCVDGKIRSFALGIQWIFVRILGTIPAPIIFGKLIDESCILWEQKSCGSERGACLMYDNQSMAKYMLLLALTGKMCSVLFFFLSSFFYVPPKITDTNFPS